MIQTAAIKVGGKIFTGKDHELIAVRIYDTTHEASGEKGYLDSNGNFLNMEQAAHAAFNAGQIKKRKKILLPKDLM